LSQAQPSSLQGCFQINESIFISRYFFPHTVTSFINHSTFSISFYNCIASNHYCVEGITPSQYFSHLTSNNIEMHQIKDELMNDFPLQVQQIEILYSNYGF